MTFAKGLIRLTCTSGALALLVVACVPSPPNLSPDASDPTQASPQVDVGPESGVPTPFASPALSPLLGYWQPWPLGPGFLEAPTRGAARARVAFGEGPDGPVGWMAPAAAQATYDEGFGQGKPAIWPVPADAPLAMVASPIPGAPARLAIAQVLSVELDGDGDGRPEGGENLLLTFQLRHEAGGGSLWRRGEVQFESAELQATGTLFLPPMGPDKGLRWALPPHPSQQAFQCRLQVGAAAPELPWAAQLVVINDLGAREVLPFELAPRLAKEENP